MDHQEWWDEMIIIFPIWKFSFSLVKIKAKIINDDIKLDVIKWYEKNLDHKKHINFKKRREKT